LFSTVNVVTDSPATRPSRSRSVAETGGSAVSTNTAVSIDGSASCAACVSHSNTEPVPDVSTSSTPPARTGAARYTVTPAIRRRLAGLPRSVTRSASAVSGCFSSCPSRNLTSARSSSPYRTVVVTAVSGVTPEGSTSRSSSALTSVLLPRLASPTTRTRSLASVSRSRRDASCSRSRSVPSTLSSLRASARALSPSGIVAILLPAFVTRLVGTVGGDAACASPARARRVKARRAPPPRPAQDSSRGCPISLGRPRPRTRSA
jgi:hypothetical protein